MSGIPPRVAAVKQQAAQMAAKAQFPPLPPIGPDPEPVAAPHGTMAGLGHAAMSGLAGMGAEAAGAGSYLSQNFGDQAAAPVFDQARQWMQQRAAAEVQKLSPQEQDMMQRQVFSLDPYKTIWQGGPGEVLHSL